MIDHFLQQDNPAIEYIEHHKRKTKSFSEFYEDIYQMIGLFEQKHLNPKDKVGIFVMPYTYAFYVLLFAGILYQLNLVVFDSYKKSHVRKLMIIEKVHYCFVDSHTKGISYFVLPRCKRILISSFKRYKKGTVSAFQNDQTILTTFTSGTTGTPKPIYRGFEYLKQQAEEIQNEMEISSIPSIFGGLPIYNLLSLYLCKTTCISKQLKHISRFQPQCVLTNIQKILVEKRIYPTISSVMVGGAILYSLEVEKIQKVFPKACITYVYGASEGAMIYKTDLKSYQQNPFTFNEKAKEIEVFIDHPNLEGIGEIVITGDKVNAVDHKHFTGDLGKLQDGMLTLVGRKKYSSLEKGFYNYLFDEEIRRENDGMAFSFYYKNQIYVVHNKKLKNKKEGIKYIFMHKLPMDFKHKTKFNYKECIDKIEKGMK